MNAGSLALFAAALIAAELLHRRDDELASDDAKAERFTASAPLAAAAAILLGPAAAAAVAAGCVLPVRRLGGDSWRESAVASFSLALATLAGGYGYLLAGSSVESVTLPDDLLGLAVLGVVFASVKTLVQRLAARAAAMEPDLLTSGAEVSLGAALAIAVDTNLWYAALLVPVLLLLERLHWRLSAVRREVAAALETFANIVDERDRSTHGHSRRVAELVRQLADALGMQQSDVRRLWWAGRLHDLGKVAVDSAVLAKPGALNDDEWAAVTRAPRLSARLLQRFRFAAQQAKAVEYHRERLDGSGYYGARGEDIPLGAHFLIVADSFDAMTSDRPFRPRLSRDAALAEIERNAGTQFHPTIARAFVALQRGERPEDALSRKELAELRDASIPSPAADGVRRHVNRPELLVAVGVAAALAGAGTELFELAVGGLAAAVLGGAVWLGRRVRAARLARALRTALSRAGALEVLFDRIVDVFESRWSLSHALLLAWEEGGTGGTVECVRGEPDVPEPEVTSWLLRKMESGDDLIVDDGTELARDGTSVALPLRRENSALVGFLVLGGRRRVPAHLVAAARSALPSLGLAFADAAGEASGAASPPQVPEPAATEVVAAGSDLSLVVCGPFVQDAAHAVTRVADELEVEVVAVPAAGGWDEEPVLESVAKTSRVAILHGNSGGELRAAEVAALVAERGFVTLDAPITRVDADDDIAAALLRLARF